MTGVNGGVVWSAVYSAFGEALVDPSSTIENHLRFPGQYFDWETGLFYNYFRSYDNKIGRYLRPDPKGLKSGINYYIYVLNNPIDNIDPLGLEVVDHGEHPEYPGGYDGCKEFCDDIGQEFLTMIPIGGGRWRCICREKLCETTEKPDPPPKYESDCMEGCKVWPWFLRPLCWYGCLKGGTGEEAHPPTN